MAAGPPSGHPEDNRAPPRDETAVPTPDNLARHRLRTLRAVQQAARAPVQYVPAALLEALQGSWGTPQAVLGAPVVPLRLLAAR